MKLSVIHHVLCVNELTLLFLMGGETVLFRNSLKLGKSGAKMTWGREHEKTVLRSVSLQNRWSMSPHSSVSSLEHSLGCIFLFTICF